MTKPIIDNFSGKFSEANVSIAGSSRFLRWKSPEQSNLEDFEKLSSDIFAWATDKGFWEESENRNLGELLALIHSEVSEALEVIRSPDQLQSDKYLPEYPAALVELADIIIRVLDLYQGLVAYHGFPHMLLEAIYAKMYLNELRPHKHGKRF